jgi:two-component system, LuxR family, response regulator FixJ
MDSTPTFTEGQRERVAKRETPAISVVDDDQSVRRSLRNFLRSVGFRVETFASAEEFLTSAQRENTGCLVLDLRMTGMGGLDLLRHLPAANIRVPAVILTAHGDEEIRQRCLGAGAVAFLDKPFHGAALLDAVQTALRGHDRRNGG